MSDQASVPPSKKGNKICTLPQEVVDQIAAGEVVQRPQSVVKELLENCLDAGSTQITVKVEKGGLGKLTIQDNGCGIPKADLALAATRHATSKLRSVQDFRSLETYGFRGEALASVSMVSQLTITSRTTDSPVGYTQTYRNGIPTLPQPRPGARKPGTTIVVENLFYNVPHRLRTYQKRESDEYNHISQVVQHYAMRYPHCGFCLERKHHQKGNLVDLNTSQISQVQRIVDKKSKGMEILKEELVEATKAVIAHVLEPTVQSHLSHLESDQQANGDAFTYQGEIYFTSPTYQPKTSHFILFLNNRLVDLPVLKRSLEDVYSDFSKHQKPILVVAIAVPGGQVDVNVHPSKRQVALMYQDELCAALSRKLKEKLQALGQSFSSESVGPSINPPPSIKKRKVDALSPESNDESQEVPPTSRTKSAKKTPPSQLIRTNKATQAGALEPFLVSTQPISGTPSSKDDDNEPSMTQAPQGSTVTSEGSDSTQAGHKSDCPLATLDVSEPGAFAIQCTCAPSNMVSPAAVVLVKRPVIRPKRVIPTKCTYASITSLRRRINKHLDQSIAKELRDACFVGVVSHFRSLIQCGERLVMLHHLELAKELFYQLALARFGGATLARLGDGGADAIDIETVITQALQLEDDLVLASSDDLSETNLVKISTQKALLTPNETNQQMAQQATTCLVDHADMLEEYFAIRIEKESGRFFLTGLPVLLDGHSPQPHGLAIFLLRLATRVDWAEERPCFQGICRELGSYYALVPTSRAELERYVKHTLFPALSFLLLPHDRFQNDGSFTTMTKLSTLYKVFERC